MNRFFSLFLALERDLIVGGQAVMEGVMMRTPNAYAIACRRSDGSIVHTSEKLPKWSDKYKFLNIPILRGGATLIQSLALGIKALNYSANIAQEDMELEEAREKAAESVSQTVLAEGTEDEQFRKSPARVTMPDEPQSKSSKAKQSAGTVGSIVFALGFNILLFIVAPLILTNLLFMAVGWAEAPVLAAGASWWETSKAYVWEIKPSSWIAFNLIDGVIRMVFFVIMIFSMSFFERYPQGVPVSRCRTQDCIRVGKRPRSYRSQCRYSKTAASAVRHLFSDGRNACGNRFVFGDQV